MQVPFPLIRQTCQTISALTQLIVGTPLSSPEGQPRLAPTGSTGILIPGMQARLVREDGSEAEYNEVGELWLKGTNVSPGYWGNEQATRETFVDGVDEEDGVGKGKWLRTGDRFSVNNDGCFLYVVSFFETFGV